MDGCSGSTCIMYVHTHVIYSLERLRVRLSHMHNAQSHVMVDPQVFDLRLLVQDEWLRS